MDCVCYCVNLEKICIDPSLNTFTAYLIPRKGKVFLLVL